MDFPLIRKKSLKAMSFFTFNSRHVFYHQLKFGFFAVGLFVDMVYSLVKKSTSSMPENVYKDPDGNE